MSVSDANLLLRRVFKDTNHPYFSFSIAGITSYLFLPEETLIFQNFIFTSTATFGFIVAGFTATQRNMLFGMSGSRVIKFAVSSGYYKDVIKSLRSCIFSAFGMIIISMILLFLSRSACSWAWRLCFSLWVGFLVMVIHRLILNERVMFLIVKRYLEQKK